MMRDDYQSGVCTLPRQHWPSQSVQSMSMTMSPPMLYTGLGVVSRACPGGTLLTKDLEAKIPGQCCNQSQKDGKMSTPIVMAKRESSVWHFCRTQTSHVWTSIVSTYCFPWYVSVFLVLYCPDTRHDDWITPLQCMDGLVKLCRRVSVNPLIREGDSWKPCFVLCTRSLFILLSENKFHFNTHREQDFELDYGYTCTWTFHLSTGAV